MDKLLNIFLVLFGFKTLHVLRRFKFFIKSPFHFLREIFVDIQKDLKFKKKFSQIIWCAGLPKSGSTLIEQILEETNYVDLSRSSLRWFNNYNLDHPHGISDRMFFYAYKNKLSYLKTHTHFSQKYFNIAKKYNVKIIVSLRDLRDVLISQVYHIKSDKRHFQHKYLRNLNFEDSLIYLIKSNFFIKGKKNKTILYYYNWIKGWKSIKGRNIIFLWYEDYLKNPNNYINKVLKFAGHGQNYYNNISKKVREKTSKEKNRSLYEKLYSPGRSKSTFREGKMGYYKSHFSKRVEKELYKIISKKKFNNAIYR